jgi:hypothetical protein
MKMFLDGSGSEFYMAYYRPIRNGQGMAVTGDRAFVLHDTGVCAVLDLISKDPRPVSVFPLGSYNAGKPSREYLNHANSCMFGAAHWGNNPIPLLYVTIGAGIGSDEDGYFYRCAVENVQQRQDGSFFSETVQTICYRPEGTLPDGLESPGWGCPCFLVDNDTGFLYIFSARYRTKRGCTPEGKKNAFIITKFNLPDPAQGGMIHLGPEDILDQFTVPSDVLFTQGGTIYNRKLYYTFGYPKGGYPLQIMAFDLRNKTLCAQIVNLTEAFRYEEIECCGIYQNRLLCNTCDGNLFALEEGLMDLT